MISMAENKNSNLSNWPLDEEDDYEDLHPHFHTYIRLDVEQILRGMHCLTEITAACRWMIVRVKIIEFNDQRAIWRHITPHTQEERPRPTDCVVQPVIS